MPGMGDSKSTTQQNSTTQPWAPAQPLLQGILGQAQAGLGNTGLTGIESNALDKITMNAQNAGQYAPAIDSYAKSLLAGGGATNEAGNVNQNYKNYYNATNPLASNTNYDPRNTPGFGDSIDALKADITNGINGSFAAAGRDFSGANSQALARGLTQGLAPIYQAQYNQNVQNQQGAARDLYSAGNSNAGILSGLQQQYLQNQGAGVGAAGAANEAQNAGPNAALAAEAARRGIPLQNLGLLAQLGIPIAGLGGQSSGTSNTTQSMSPIQQFMGITQGIGNLLPKAPIKFG